jgi:Rhodopirellula transposase DDE domain
LLKDTTAGDPITGVKWTRKTVRRLTDELRRKCFKVKRETVRRLLIQLGYRLRVNRKRLVKTQDPQRDQQMRYIARMRKHYVRAGRPVISVDTKKRELIGNFKNAGRTWRQAPIDVLESDYPNDADGVAIPYGIYDVIHDQGCVVVGTSHQTPAFAAHAIRTWWLKMGVVRFVGQHDVLIEADGGNPNGCRSWLWKFHLQHLADEFGLTITVTHLPTGASKWNPVEHKLFCFITRNWAGQPLISYETILKFIRTTNNESGLRCRAFLDTTHYETGQTLSPHERAQINLAPHRVLPQWNYTIKPNSTCRK